MTVSWNGEPKVPWEEKLRLVIYQKQKFMNTSIQKRRLFE